MEYFKQVTPPKNTLNVNTNTPKINLDIFSQLLSKIEQRALDVVNEKYPYMLDLVGKNPIIIDPYAIYSPDDTTIWQEIFISTQKNRELYARLFFIRGGGTKLIRNQQWGFIFQPAIGVNGWTSMEEYDREKQCLNGYRDEIVPLLQNIEMKIKCGS